MLGRVTHTLSENYHGLPSQSGLALDMGIGMLLGMSNASRNGSALPGGSEFVGTICASACGRTATVGGERCSWAASEASSGSTVDEDHDHGADSSSDGDRIDSSCGLKKRVADRKQPRKAVPSSLDEILTLEECASWLALTTRDLKEKVRAGRIPAIRLNQRVFRFHPRTVLLKLGVPRDAVETTRNHEPPRRPPAPGNA